MIIDSPIISGSYLSTGSLSQTGNVSITGSLTATAGISGSFSGSGADLFGIPASGITGLNLSQISSGSVSASISPNQGLLINTSVSASNFTGSFTGSLTGIATSASYAAFALTSSYSLGGSGFPFSGSAVITGSLLVSGSAEITGSLSVSGSISASLFGTASQATSASYALTASYLLGYISPFPFTGSAAITGSLIVTGSVAISTLVTSSGVRYVIADQNGLLSAQTASAAIFTTQQVVSTAGQTTFPITNGYATGYVTVFVNGTKLSADEYVDTSGTNIVFLTGSTAGDNVEFQKYLPAAGVSNNTLRSTNYFTATTGQTDFTVNYTPGLIDIFYNGAKLDNTEYTAANGTSITLATASAAGDRLEVDVYSYQVGAFSGIGGVGVAKELAFYNTTNSITGSNKVTYDGSTFSITGSFLVTGSSTFTNIGPAVFSGSVTAVGGFSGSFSGNADSASLAQNSLLLQGTGSIGFATTASLLAVSASQQQISSSLLNVIANYATTGSNSFRADQSITGSLVVSSTITAQTLVVQTVTSSILYSSGSNVFGNQLANAQTFTGSVNITGSLALAGNISGNAITLTSALDGTSATFSGNNHSLASNNTLRFTDTDTATEANQQIGKIEFYSSDSSTPGAGVKAYIGAFAQDTTPDAYLSFATQDGSATPNPVERLRISSEGLATFNGNVAIGKTAGSTFIFDALKDDSTTNSIIGVVQIGRATTGTAANGIGGNIQLTAEDTAGNQRTAAYIGWQLTNASSAAPEGYMYIGSRNSADALKILDSGAATFSGTVASGDTLTINKAKAGSGVENLNALVLRITGTGAIGDGTNIAFNNTNNTSIAFITGITGGDNVAYGSLSFSTRNYNTDSVVEIMRLGNRGNVGIGTTTPNPAYKLDVSGDIRATGTIYANANGTMYFRGGDDAGLYDVNIANTMGIYGVQDSTVGTIRLGSSGGTLSGYSGRIGVNVTTPDQALHVVDTTNDTVMKLGGGGAARDTNFTMYSQSATNTVTAIHYNGQMAFYSGKFVINSNGSASLTGALTQNTSDIRLKTNIAIIENALDKIKQLSGFTYNWNALANELGGFDTNIREVGVAAQSIKDVVPEAVFPAPFDNGFDPTTQSFYSKSGENYLTVQYEKLVPLLIEGIKEQNVLIQELQEKLQRNHIN